MHLRKCLAAGCMLAALSVMAKAAPDHDPVLEDAAIRLAVSKLGELRGGFADNQQPKFYRPEPAKIEARQGDAVWQDGLAPATDLPTMTIKRP